MFRRRQTIAAAAAVSCTDQADALARSWTGQWSEVTLQVMRTIPVGPLDHWRDGRIRRMRDIPPLAKVVC
jgi:hypothetical protein